MHAYNNSLRSIKHPNIVRMFCVEEEVKTNEPCIIMELCTGLFLIISKVSDQRFALLIIITYYTKSLIVYPKYT